MLFITCWGRWKWNWSWELDGIEVKCTINFLEAGELNWTQLVFLSVVSTDCTQTPFLNVCHRPKAAMEGQVKVYVLIMSQSLVLSLEGMMLKLKLQYFGYLMWRVDSLESQSLHWKRLWCWEGLGAGGEGDDRGWDGWMASLTRWMWVSLNPGSWWWTGRPGVLQFMGLQRVGHDWATELNWMTYDIEHLFICLFAICTSSWMRFLFWSFFIGLFIFLLLRFI